MKSLVRNSSLASSHCRDDVCGKSATCNACDDVAVGKLRLQQADPRLLGLHVCSVGERQERKQISKFIVIRKQLESNSAAVKMVVLIQVM